jgi:hypothetical protein
MHARLLSAGQKVLRDEVVGGVSSLYYFDCGCVMFYPMSI